MVGNCMAVSEVKIWKEMMRYWSSNFWHRSIELEDRYRRTRWLMKHGMGQWRKDMDGNRGNRQSPAVKGLYNDTVLGWALELAN